METVLLVVTMVALALAIGMSVLAWRLLRGDRDRATARADALLTMATTEEFNEPPSPAPAPASHGLGLGAWGMPGHRSLGEGGGPEPWDLALRQERSAPSQAPHLDIARGAVSESRTASPRPAPARAEFVSAPTFGAVEERGAPPRRWLALAAVVVFMSAIVGTVYALYRPASAAEASADPTAAPVHQASVSGQARPLELLSLRHANESDGAFTVTGLVQNPFDGRVIHRVTAVVYLFDRDGNYFASGKAALDFTALQPGDESPFVVHIPNVGHVSRYRVGFRSEEGGVIAHIDRRGQLPGGTTGDAVDTAPTVPATRRSEG
jgi:hypothetical protein